MRIEAAEAAFGHQPESFLFVLMYIGNMTVAQTLVMVIEGEGLILGVEFYESPSDLAHPEDRISLAADAPKGARLFLFDGGQGELREAVGPAVPSDEECAGVAGEPDVAPGVF